MQNTIDTIKHTRNPGVWRRVDQGFHQNLCLRSTMTWLSGEPGGAQRLQGVASHGGGEHILKGFSSGAKKRPVMLSCPSRVSRKRWAATPGAPRSFASSVAQKRCRASRPFCTLRCRCSSLRGSVSSDEDGVNCDPTRPLNKSAIEGEPKHQPDIHLLPLHPTLLNPRWLDDSMRTLTLSLPLLNPIASCNSR